MAKYPRYAVYFVPPADSLLYRFGASLLGYEVFTGQPLPFAEGIEAEIADWKQLTTDPRKYGFHATLKAPISIKSEDTEDQLLEAVQEFARTPRIIPVINPVVRAIGGFIAIVPETPSADLQRLAGDCVTAFDEFRAPLTAEDRKRRVSSALTERQLAHLDRWGYPYVLEEFRFHMTLTGSIQAERHATALDCLQERFSALNLYTVAIDRIAVLCQDDPASGFKIILTVPLAAGASSS